MKITSFSHLVGPKSLDWSYPSSDNARNAGYADRGCWTVSIATESGVQAVSSFLCFPDAVAFAAALPNAWDKYTLRFRSQIMDEARILGDSEVPRVGDFYRWSDADRDVWEQLSKGNSTLINLPVATLRVRCGQPELQFRTFSA